MELKYKITFYSCWHCGSGLAAGADIDLLTVKDKDGLPFIPGKTLKGLFREAVDNYVHFTECKANVNKAFGKESINGEAVEPGLLYFANAVMDEHEHDEIVKSDCQEFMFRKVASTSIDENGIAERHSLRSMEVAIPCTLNGKILDVPDEMTEIIKESAGFIKRLGQHRNRGLGRCKITFE